VNAEQQKAWDRLLHAKGEGLHATTIFLAREYTKRFPHDMFGWIVLARGLSKVHSFTDALKALRMARSLCVDRFQDFLCAQMGHFYSDKGDHRRAEKWYRKANDIKRSQEHLVFLGASLLRQGKFAESKEKLKMAVTIDQAAADEAWFNLALVARGEENLLEALEFLENAIKIDHEYDDAVSVREDILKAIKMRATAGRARLRTGRSRSA
jgi:tetratricopeptide (TPR) repeat protein